MGGDQPAAASPRGTWRAAEIYPPAAVDAATAAQPEWAATNPQRRARVMFKFR